MKNQPYQGQKVLNDEKSCSIALFRLQESRVAKGHLEPGFCKPHTPP